MYMLAHVLTRHSARHLLAYPVVIKAKIGGGKTKKIRNGQEGCGIQLQPISVPTK